MHSQPGMLLQTLMPLPPPLPPPPLTGPLTMSTMTTTMSGSTLRPSQQQWGDTSKSTGTTPKQVSMLSVISSAVKISLHVYFEGSNWLLNKAPLPSWAEFLCGPLGDIMRQYCLEKTQVAR